MWQEAKNNLQRQMANPTLGSISAANAPAGAVIGTADGRGPLTEELKPITPPIIAPGKENVDSAFEAGQLFAHFDGNKDGQLDKKEFETLMSQIPGLFKPSSSLVDPSAKAANPPLFPTEIISGRVLTHYDETTGIPLPKSSVDQHLAMGNVVIPLVEAYRTRYERLRALLTSKLLPKREHLLQLRRNLYRYF